MKKHEFQTDYQNCFEYHGNTAIELTRKQEGITIFHDWILFDSVEEASEYFNDYCGDLEVHYA